MANASRSFSAAARAWETASSCWTANDCFWVALLRFEGLLLGLDALQLRLDLGAMLGLLLLERHAVGLLLLLEPELERLLLLGEALGKLRDACVPLRRGVRERALALGLRHALGRLLLRRQLFERRRELGDLRVLLRDGGAGLLFLARDGQLDRLFVGLGEHLLATRDLLRELGVAHLLQNGRETGFVDGEHLAAMRALDLVHARSFSRIPRFYPIAAQRQPSFSGQPKRYPVISTPGHETRGTRCANGSSYFGRNRRDSVA